MRQLEHRHPLTYVSVMILSTWKIHLAVPEVPARLPYTVETLNDMQRATTEYIQYNVHPLPEGQGCMLCIIDQMLIATRCARNVCEFK